MRAAGVLLAAFAAVVVVGCGTVENFVQPPPAVIPLEVWNRTQDDLFLIDDEGRLLGVPACGHAEAMEMSTTTVELRIDAGRITTYGMLGVRQTQYLVVIAVPGKSNPVSDRPQALPACVGHLADLVED